MGNTKQSTDTSSQSSSTTTPIPTASDTTLNPLETQSIQNWQPLLNSLIGASGSATQSLLNGQALPGAYGTQPYGVDQNAQQAIVNQSLRDIPTSLQAAGALDSEAGQAYYARNAEYVRSQLAQFNSQQSLNALAAGFGGVQATTQPMFSQEQLLNQRLAGLRGSTTQGTTNTQTVQTQNPFLNSFYSSLGQGAGQFTSGAAGGLGQSLGSGVGNLGLMMTLGGL